ncbi:SecDF P1 head subdomain-containing protein [Kribbella sp. NPDC055071]
MVQLPQYPPPVRRRRGLLVLLGSLVLVLVVVVGAFFWLVYQMSDPKGAPANNRPATPTAVEFRRVLKADAGACPSPAPAGAFCGSGLRYTLGKVELDGSHVTEVKSAKSEQGTPPYWYVSLTLDDVGTRLFGDLTADLAKKPAGSNLLAIVVRNEVVATPSVSSSIPGGQVEIAGNFTQADVEALAAKITG